MHLNKAVGYLFVLAIWITLAGWVKPGWSQIPQGTVNLDEEVRFEHLSVKQGLSHNEVLCIRQDQEGFIWMGTKDGLNKYDGYSFSVYKPDPLDPTNTLGHNWVNNVFEDRKGRLWVTTHGGGLHQMDKRTGKLTVYRIDPTKINDRNVCRAITEDQQGMLWIASQGGLNELNPTTGEFKLYEFNHLDAFGLTAVCEDRLGVLWVGSRGGLYQLDRKTRTFSRFALNEADTEGAERMYQDEQGIVWLSSPAGRLYSLEPNTQQVTYFPKPPAFQEGRPTALYTDAAGYIWMGVTGNAGLQRLHPETGQWVTFRANFAEYKHLSSNQIKSIYQDRSGILWIGTDNGINTLFPQPKKFRTIQLIEDHQSANLPENNILAVCRDQSGTIWLGNEAGGLYTLHPESGQFSQYPVDSTNPRHLYTHKVTAISEGRSGNVWVATGRFLHQIDQKKGVTKRYRADMEIRAIREDSAHAMLWLGGWGGVASLDQQTGRITYFRHDPPDSTSLSDNNVVTILRSRTGAVWAATGRRGLNKLDPATGTFIHYQPNYAQPAGHLNDRDIRSLYEDEQGILWIGTNQGGLNRFDPRTGVFTAFTTHDGLPSNHIVGIQGDAAGNLWLATNQGMCRFNPQTKACRNYDADDGLQGEEFGEEFFEVCAKGPNGELLFGGPNGLNVFFPDRIRDNPQIPPVHITGIRVENQLSTSSRDTLELSYKENSFSFDFVALNFIRPEKNQYAYQLIGVDKNWVYSGNRRFAAYTNLDPGEYTFQVKASNNDGVWNTAGTTLKIIIHPPFWRTWWFVTLACLAFGGLAYSGFQYRVRQIRREETQKTEFNKRLSEMELQTLRAQMNPHFIFNSLNSINRFIMSNEPEEASDYLAKFSKLIRLILQNSNSPTITLENELEALQLYLKLEVLRFKGKFTFVVQISEEVEPAYIEIPPLIIQPYVENAIWHGLMHKEGIGRLTIQLKQENNVLICIIEDDGIGRQKAAQLRSKSATRTKSMGMQITAHRLELSNALYGKKTTVSIVDLVDPDGEPCGTRVELHIPAK